MPEDRPQDDPAHQDRKEMGEPRSTVRTVASEELLQGQQEIQIVHANEIYRLRVTRNGKLILYK